MLRREARGVLIALLLVAVTTAALFFLRHYFGILRGAVLYLLPVMIAGYQLGMIPALVTAIAGVFLSGYLVFAPLYSFQVASPQEALNLLLFMGVAVVVSHLSSQAKQHILNSGYASVSDLTKGSDGIWRGVAMKGGQTINVALDFKGNVSEQGLAGQ